MKNRVKGFFFESFFYSVAPLNLILQKDKRKKLQTETQAKYKAQLRTSAENKWRIEEKQKAQEVDRTCYTNFFFGNR